MKERIFSKKKRETAWVVSNDFYQVDAAQFHTDSGQKATNEDSNKSQRKSRNSLKKNHTR